MTWHGTDPSLFCEPSPCSDDLSKNLQHSLTIATVVILNKGALRESNAVENEVYIGLDAVFPHLSLIIMMDPVTSFALAANVVQFVGLGVKLVRKSAEYAVGGGSEEYKTLHGLIERLAMSSAHLHSDLETASPGSIQPGPERALHLANTECLEVSREFTAFLSEFKLDDSRRFWSSRE